MLGGAFSMLAVTIIARALRNRYVSQDSNRLMFVILALSVTDVPLRKRFIMLSRPTQRRKLIFLNLAKA